MLNQLIGELRAETRGLGLVESLSRTAQLLPGKVAFSTSFGQEDQVLSHLIFSNRIPIRVFTLDTGRLFEATHDLWEATRQRYGAEIEVGAPDAVQLRELIREIGPNGFYSSVEARKRCCHIRKVVPLREALQGTELWITGLRAGQSSGRNETQAFELDEKFGLVKYNPLWDWSLEDVTEFLEAHDVPQNRLHAEGFVSIGCAPCTRAIEPGEDIRAGRWWWEAAGKECGLHADYFNPSQPEPKA